MRKRLLHSIEITIGIVFFMLIVFGCDTQATYSEYSLAGRWESTNEYDYFSEASSRVARAESEVFETMGGPISSSGISGTLPKAVIIRYDESMPKSRELATSIGKYRKEVPRAEGVGFDFSRIEIPADETTGMEEIINYYE